jgi:hypothetical protein
VLYLTRRLTSRCALSAVALHQLVGRSRPSSEEGQRRGYEHTSPDYLHPPVFLLTHVGRGDMRLGYGIPMGWKRYAYLPLQTSVC